MKRAAGVQFHSENGLPPLWETIFRNEMTSPCGRESIFSLKTRSHSVGKVLQDCKSVGWENSGVFAVWTDFRRKFSFIRVQKNRENRAIRLNRRRRGKKQFCGALCSPSFCAFNLRLALFPGDTSITRHCFLHLFGGPAKVGNIQRSVDLRLQVIPNLDALFGASLVRF